MIVGSGDLPPYDSEIAGLIDDLHTCMLPVALLSSDIRILKAVLKMRSIDDDRILEDVRNRRGILNEKEAMDAGFRVVAFDLDGTLAEYDGWDGGRIGKPIMSEVNHLIHEFERGSYIILFTTRLNIRLWGVVSVDDQSSRIHNWLKSNGILQYISLIVGDKPLAHEYRDDRSVNPTLDCKLHTKTRRKPSKGVKRGSIPSIP